MSVMSCIKFPSSKSELLKTTNKETVNDFNAVNSHLINTANEVFGKGNWSHSINNQTLDFIDYTTGKYQAGCASIVRVQLKDGTFHEDMGYSFNEGSSKGSAIQRARLGSFNDALRKALLSFGNEVAKRINKVSSRPSSPLPSEQGLSKVAQIEAQAPIITAKVGKEVIEEIIPMSQTDAIMESVDFDSLLSKDKNSNTVLNTVKEVNMINPKVVINTVNENIKTSEVLSQNSTPADNAIDKGKDKNFVSCIKKELKVDAVKSNTLSGSSNTIEKHNPNVAKGVIAELKPEIPKPVVSTAMTEEEMRLERKRKQREMQEEFKRKEEYKRKHVDTEAKPNPRY